jgi:hypothetical protein
MPGLALHPLTTRSLTRLAHLRGFLRAPNFGFLSLGSGFGGRPRFSRPGAVNLIAQIRVNFLEPVLIHDLRRQVTQICEQRMNTFANCLRNVVFFGSVDKRQAGQPAGDERGLKKDDGPYYGNRPYYGGPYYGNRPYYVNRPYYSGRRSYYRSNPYSGRNYYRDEDDRDRNHHDKDRKDKKDKKHKKHHDGDKKRHDGDKKHHDDD